MIGKGDSLIDSPHPEVLNTSLDLVSLPEDEGEATWEWETLFDQATPGL